PVQRSLTPFPYTTLFRSASIAHKRRSVGARHSDACVAALDVHRLGPRLWLRGRRWFRCRPPGGQQANWWVAGCVYASGADVADRSEEHTSELQSRENLVC